MGADHLHGCGLSAVVLIMPLLVDAAKRGFPLVTRDGRKVTFIAHYPSLPEQHRVVVNVNGMYAPVTVSEDGRFHLDGRPSSFDVLLDADQLEVKRANQ